MENAINYMSKENSSYFDAICTVNYLKTALEKEDTMLSDELLKNLNKWVEARIDKTVSDFCKAMNNSSLCQNDPILRQNALKVALELLERYPKQGTEQTVNDKNSNDEYASIQSEIKK